MSSWRDKGCISNREESIDGYKVHDNVDEDGFIKATDYSTGSLHDSKIDRWAKKITNLTG